MNMNLNALCRCCHKDGNFKSLEDTFVYENKVEVYGQMLRDTFDLFIQQLLLEASNTICEECIVRLRDAYKFKKQVLHCEKTLELYCKNEHATSFNGPIKTELDSDNEIEIESEKLQEMPKKEWQNVIGIINVKSEDPEVTINADIVPGIKTDSHGKEGKKAVKNNFTNMSRRKQIHFVNIPNDSEDELLSDDNEDWVPNADPLHTFDSELDSESSDLQPDDEKEDKVNQPSTSRRGVNSRPTFKWLPEQQQYNEENYTFLGDICLTPEIKALKTPSEIFDYFFTPDMVNYIVNESNRYSFEKQNDFNVSPLQFRQFIGVLIYMSVIHYPSTRHFWKTGMGFDPISKTMTCNRFENIKRFTHFINNADILSPQNNDYDKLQKIRPFLNAVRERLLMVPKEEFLAVDEQIIPAKTRQSDLKQYNPKKRHKWGYKVYVLSGASGFSYDFDLDAGKQSDIVPEGEKNIGTSSNVVLRLTQTVPEHHNHKIFFDNWFTSVDLMVEMDKKGIVPLGTLRSNRLPGAKLLTKPELSKKGRDSAVEQKTVVGDTQITAVSLLDSKVGNNCSTYVGVKPTGSVKRYNREKRQFQEIDCPRAILLYNRRMGEVDTLDSMLGHYRILVRSKKWYMRVFFHMIDLITVNSWLIWRRLNKDSYKPLLDFKLLLAESLTQQGSFLCTPRTTKRASEGAVESPLAKRYRKRLDLPPREVAGDGVYHFPEWTNERQVCKNVGCNGKSYVRCLKCRAHLCLNKTRNCYMEFHSE